MAMHVPKAPGFGQMLKDGARHFSGLEEAVYKNIEACKELVQTTKSSYGPHGQNKMVINHLDKLFVTNDAATILRELEVQHPAAKMIVMASQQQEQECGDGTNFVMVLAGALLSNAAELLRMGLPVTEVVDGYEMAVKKALEILPELVVGSVKDLHSKSAILPLIRTAVMSKQCGFEDFLADLIVDACLSIYREKSSSFNVDNVRVCKVLGCGVQQSLVIQGMAFKRAVEGEINKADKCKVAVYSCPLDIMQTETKGTVLIKTAEELLNYSKGEENQIEQQIKAIAESGCTVIVAGGKVGEMALHFCNKYKILVLRLLSKFDLRRLCRTIQATALPKITAPTQAEMGFCDHVYVDEIGDTSVVVFKQDQEESGIATIVIRGSTDNIMDDIERAIDDGVNTFKAATKDDRYLSGAGSTEIELANRITKFGESVPGLEQYSIKKFAESLESLPRALSENTGAKATEVLAKLYAAHHDGNQRIGVSVDEVGGIMDANEAQLFDLYMTKHWAIKFAVSSACTVLKVDQIIMAKQAGGPKPKEQKNDDDD